MAKQDYEKREEKYEKIVRRELPEYKEEQERGYNRNNEKESGTESSRLRR